MHPVFLIAPLLLGISSGLRALTPVAIIFIALWCGFLSLNGTWLAFLDSTFVLITAMALAVGELIGDKLPFTPNRTDRLGLIGRIFSGALCGAILITALSGNSTLGIAAGATVGMIGALIGTFGGFSLRTRLSKRLGVHDLYVAIPEDLLAISLACLAIFIST